MLSQLRVMIGSLLLALLVAGCGGGSPTTSPSQGGSTTPPSSIPPTTTPTPHLDHIAISPASQTVAPGQSFAFTATAYDQFNHPFAAMIAWTSDGSPVTDGSGVAH